MPLTPKTTIDPVVPNAVYYAFSAAPRISNGRLAVASTLIFYPARCDDGVWSECTIAGGVNDRVVQSADIEAFAAQYPDLAPLVASAWGALNALADAVNAKMQVI